MSEYRYPEHGGRRVRPPRQHAFCKICRTRVKSKYLNAEGLCDSCRIAEPLFVLVPAERN